jgi:hypothetical protein
MRFLVLLLLITILIHAVVLCSGSESGSIILDDGDSSPGDGSIGIISSGSGSGSGSGESERHHGPISSKEAEALEHESDTRRGEVDGANPVKGRFLEGFVGPNNQLAVGLGVSVTANHVDLMRFDAFAPTQSTNLGVTILNRYWDFEGLARLKRDDGDGDQGKALKNGISSANVTGERFGLVIRIHGIVEFDSLKSPYPIFDQSNPSFNVIQHHKIGSNGGFRGWLLAKYASGDKEVSFADHYIASAGKGGGANVIAAQNREAGPGPFEIVGKIAETTFYDNKSNKTLSPNIIKWDANILDFPYLSSNSSLAFRVHIRALHANINFVGSDAQVDETKKSYVLSSQNTDSRVKSAAAFWEPIAIADGQAITVSSYGWSSIASVADAQANDDLTDDYDAVDNWYRHYYVFNTNSQIKKLIYDPSVALTAASTGAAASIIVNSMCLIIACVAPILAVLFV